VPVVVYLLLTAGYFVRDETNEFDQSPVLLICDSINQMDGAALSWEQPGREEELKAGRIKSEE
jgi:hypothetical protein